jgi:hypothetical protein
MIVVGIDPGLSGAVCVLGERGGPRVFSMPLRRLDNGRDEVDDAVLWHLLPPVHRVGAVVLEEVGGDPRFGGSRAFNFGKGFGQVLAVLRLNFGTVLLVRVRPQRWKKAILGPGPSWSKEMAVAHVQSVFPELGLTPSGKRKPSHDWAEAVCLALYGLKHLQGDL